MTSTILSSLALVISLAALWLAIGPIKSYAKWKVRFGHRGIPGWFVGQWYRVKAKFGWRPDYRMTPEPRVVKSIPPNEGCGWLGGAEGVGDFTEWNPPACADSRLKRPGRPPQVNQRLAAAKEKGNDWSKLTDEELAEEMKTARIGDGLAAEAGYRQFMKQMGEVPGAKCFPGTDIPRLPKDEK
jgi:hypothetical protein